MGICYTDNVIFMGSTLHQMDKKVERIIKLYSYLLEGKVINKKEEANRFEVNQRTIQRDIDDIRMYFANDMNVNWQVVYERSKNGYILVRDKDETLNSQEILMLCKVFMQSRTLVKEEMFSVIDKLVRSCMPYDDKKKLATLLANEKIHYKNPEHGKRLESLIKDIVDAVYTHKLLMIDYEDKENAIGENIVIEPMGIVFAQNHFYLTAYVVSKMDEIKEDRYREKKQQAIYRLDKISDCKLLQKHFHVPYKNRYEEENFLELVDREIATSREKTLFNVRDEGEL